MNDVPDKIAFLKTFISFEKLIFDTRRDLEGLTTFLLRGPGTSIISKGQGAIFVVDFPGGAIATGHTTMFGAPSNTTVADDNAFIAFSSKPDKIFRPRREVCSHHFAHGTFSEEYYDAMGQPNSATTSYVTWGSSNPQSEKGCFYLFSSGCSEIRGGYCYGAAGALQNTNYEGPFDAIPPSQWDRVRVWSTTPATPKA